MWMCKSEEQLAKERNGLWLSPYEPVVVFLICFVANMGIIIRGPLAHFGNVQQWPDTWPKALGYSAVTATVLAIADCVLQLAFRRTLVSFMRPVKVVMCDTCHRVKHRDSETTCECGGAFDDFDNWTWVDGAEEESANTTSNSSEREM